MAGRDSPGIREPVRLAMWSGPRNISTAMMRSWENRPDTIVVDEPLYPCFLAATGIDHPGRDEVLAVGETDWRVVVDQLLGPVPSGIAVFFQKHMAHHLVPGLEHGWMRALTNVLLIREPGEVVASYVKAREQVSADDIGLPQQAMLYDEWTSWGMTPRVIDAADFLRDPETHLRWLCDWLGIDFTDRMLSWPEGLRDSDGVWAPHWYDAVARSTGFEPWRPREIALSAHDGVVAETCRPAYDALYARRLVL